MVENPTENPTNLDLVCNRRTGQHQNQKGTWIFAMGPSILTGESIPCFFLLNLNHGKYQNQQMEIGHGNHFDPVDLCIVFGRPICSGVHATHSNGRNHEMV
jgi:hypothetical protein